MSEQGASRTDRSITVTENGRDVSTIHIGGGIAADLAAVLTGPPRRIGVLTQPTTRPIADRTIEALNDAGHSTSVYELPDREDAKTLAVLEDVAQFFNDHAMTRSDLVVGIGGGAATDLAGFAAAVYLRGVECVLVPTTLLAAVDASIGGKTAVNVGGKNLVGAFHHPSHVLVDTTVLAALPDEILREGAAEAVKAGFIADPALVDLYEADGLHADLATVLERSIAVKARVVSADFTEQGERATLNYGHTIGHAVEMASGLPHGHSVAIGMVAAAAVSETLVGFSERERHDAVIAGLGLPTQSPVSDADVLRRYVSLDKKRDSDGLRMVLLPEFGRTTLQHVDAATVTAALAAVGAA